MNKRPYFLHLIFFIIYAFQLTANEELGQQILEHFCPSSFNQLPISNWFEPTLNDYQMIENYLRQRQSRIANAMESGFFLLPNQLDGWISYRIGRTKITNGTDPKLIKVDFGNDPNNREICIICYVSQEFGGRFYENGLKTMIQALTKLKFKGHLIYRIGGWPSLSNGRLRYADVPYAFKPFMFEEVKDMGYKHILWLDSCCIPIKNLSPIFEKIKEHGYCFYFEGKELFSTLQNWDFIRRSLDVPKRTRYKNVITQIVGISTVHPQGISLLEDWIVAACKKLPFLSGSGDQLCFSFLINQRNHENNALPESVKCENNSLTFEFPKNADKAFFYHNYQLIDSMNSPGEYFFLKINE